jgi:hypothetical protein
MSRRVPFTGGEKESLHVSLDRHQDAVLWKLEGLSDADLHVRPDETTQAVLDSYARARAAADQTIDDLDLEATGTAWFGDASRCAGS